MNPYKILIIEDDAKIRDELQILLQANGYITAFVEDFSNVKDIFHAEQPHLVLLDIKLPNASGFSICSQIHSISNVPIIFVTSCNTDMDELNSLSVEDNGIGIPKSDLSRIFEKGFTGQNGRAVHSSTGIGLYLCKRLCDKLDIGLTVSSSDKGTTVSLIFSVNDFVAGVQG